MTKQIVYVVCQMWSGHDDGPVAVTATRALADAYIADLKRTLKHYAASGWPTDEPKLYTFTVREFEVVEAA